MNIKEVDWMICNKFKFEHTDGDYGHFYFTETEEELGTFQKSISWAALVHTIVYYSNINFGKSSTYDIEAAIAWIREHTIHFPHSTIAFTSKLVEFLKQKGMYIFVNFHRNNDCNENEYVNKYNSYQILRNESGMFECDDDGKLLRFYPDAQNLLDETEVKRTDSFGKHFFKPYVHSLIIPEGVTTINEGFFRDGFVKDTIYFPNTLRSIGSGTDSCVFSDSHLPDIIIPDKVNMIGRYAFGHSIIKSIKFYRIFECEYLRQFKDAKIETLFLPHDCPPRWRKFPNVHLYLFNANHVEFY